MIRELREKLAADLAVLDVAVLDAWPDRVTVPAVLVTTPSAGPYVVSGPQFSTFTISLDLVCLVGRGSPAIALAELELLLEGVLLNSMDWELSDVDSPAALTVANQELLGSVVHVAKTSEL